MDHYFRGGERTSEMRTTNKLLLLAAVVACCCKMTFDDPF